jgi:hypothetical protein
MKFSIFAIISILATTALAQSENSALADYIVVLITGAVTNDILAILKLVGIGAPSATQQWSAKGFTGFIAKLSPGQVKVLQASPSVSYDALIFMFL